MASDSKSSWGSNPPTMAELKEREMRNQELRDMQDMRDVHREMEEASSRGEAVLTIAEQVRPPHVYISDCYLDCIRVCPMVLFIFFYFLFVVIYKFFGSFAACFYSRRKCCHNTGPKGTGHNPCGPCLGSLINLVFYLLFAIFASIAFVFYIACLGPLRLLACMSTVYETEYAAMRFSLTVLMEEDAGERPSQPSNRVGDVEMGLAESRGEPGGSGSPPRAKQTAVVTPSKVQVTDEPSFEAVMPFKPVDDR